MGPIDHVEDDDDSDGSVSRNSDLEWSLPSRQGLLAKTPANFARFGNVVPFYASPGNGPSSITNKGVRLSISLLHEVRATLTEEFLLGTALLDCHFETDTRGQVGLPLCQVRRGDDQYFRLLADPSVVPLRNLLDAVEEIIYVKDPQEIAVKDVRSRSTYDRFFVVPEFTKTTRFMLVEVFPVEQWDENEGLFCLEKQSGQVLFAYENTSGSAYMSRSSVPARFIVILEYTSMIRRLVKYIMIKKDEGKSLKYLWEHASNPIRKEKPTGPSVELKYGNIHVCVNIEIRRRLMFNKRLFFVDTSVLVRQ